MNLNKLVKSAIFSATAIGLGFTFLMVPNVEFISVTIFLSGLYLGSRYGALVGGVSIMMYSILNPMGSGLAYIPLLIGQIISMTIIGILGSYSSFFLKKVRLKIRVLCSGLAGFISTFIYDFITTISFPLSVGYSLNEIIIYGISGLVFTAMHLISNTIIFMIVLPKFIDRIKT